MKERRLPTVEIDPRRLGANPVTVIDGEAFIDLPPPPAAGSRRDSLLGVTRRMISPEEL